MGLLFHLLPLSVLLWAKQSAEMLLYSMWCAKILFPPSSTSQSPSPSSSIFSHLSKQIKRVTFCLYYIVNIYIHVREYIGEYLCIYSSLYPSIFINSFLKKNFLASFVSICHPHLQLVSQIFPFFIHSFIHSYVRGSFVRLRVKINNFFCCSCCFCYFIRIYCVHFCNILWLLSYLSVLSAIYISNWYTFEIRHIFMLLLLLFDIFDLTARFNTQTPLALCFCMKSSHLNVWRAK